MTLMMNTGWRAISRNGLPELAPGKGALCSGNSMNDRASKDSAATPISATYAPAKGTASISFVALAKLGPMKAPMMPPASTMEMAFSFNDGATNSGPAKR